MESAVGGRLTSLDQGRAGAELPAPTNRWVKVRVWWPQGLIRVHLLNLRVLWIVGLFDLAVLLPTALFWPWRRVVAPWRLRSALTRGSEAGTRFWLRRVVLFSPVAGQLSHGGRTTEQFSPVFAAGPGSVLGVDRTRRLPWAKWNQAYKPVRFSELAASAMEQGFRSALLIVDGGGPFEVGLEDYNRPRVSDGVVGAALILSLLVGATTALAAAIPVPRASKACAVIRELSSDEVRHHGRDMRCVDLGVTNLGGLNFDGADLRGSRFQVVVVPEDPSSGKPPRFEHANMAEADLVGTDLAGVDFRGAVLKSAQLFGADLTGADLRDADLRGADLSRAKLSGAFTEGALWSGATCPDGTVADPANGCSDHLAVAP